MTQKQIGGYGFRQECTDIRNSAAAIRTALSRIIEENPGPQTTAMLVAKMAIEVSKIANAVNLIEEIGKQHRTTG